MTFWRMPLLVWANFTTSLLVVIATPFIAGSQFFVLLDRTIGTKFFDPAAGGDVLMYQHVFWFYSHPAVYIMMLPGFGISSFPPASFDTAMATPGLNLSMTLVPVIPSRLVTVPAELAVAEVLWQKHGK